MTWDVEIKEYHAVANWTWDAGDDVCSICRMSFDGCPPDCKVGTGGGTRLHVPSAACRCCSVWLEADKLIALSADANVEVHALRCERVHVEMHSLPSCTGAGG